MIFSNRDRSAMFAYSAFCCFCSDFLFRFNRRMSPGIAFACWRAHRPLVGCSACCQVIVKAAWYSCSSGLLQRRCRRFAAIAWSVFFQQASRLWNVHFKLSQASCAFFVLARNAPSSSLGFVIRPIFFFYDCDYSEDLTNWLLIEILNSAQIVRFCEDGPREAKQFAQGTLYNKKVQLPCTLSVCDNLYWGGLKKVFYRWRLGREIRLGRQTTQRIPLKFFATPAPLSLLTLSSSIFRAPPLPLA